MSQGNVRSGPGLDHNCPGHFGRIVLPHAVVNPLFVGLLVAVLQTTCFHCHRMRLSPYYVSTMMPGRARMLHRIKAIGALCMRQAQCRSGRHSAPWFVSMSEGLVPVLPRPDAHV